MSVLSVLSQKTRVVCVGEYYARENFMKKVLLRLSCLMVCIFSFGLMSCVKDNQLYEKGISVTTVMGEMVKSEVYTDMLGGENSDNVLVRANDYDTPIKCYGMTVPSAERLIESVGSADYKEQFESLSPTLQEQIKSRSTFLTVINYENFSNSSVSSVEAMALSAIYAAHLKFNGKLDETVAYLYIFETGKPIVVIFTPIDKKHFLADGYFFFSKDCSSLSSVRNIFEKYGCNVEKVA